MTPRQRRIVDAIQRLTDREVGPSYEELMAATGIATKSVLHGHLVRLKAQGRVDWNPNQSRTLRVVSAGPYSAAALTRLGDDTLFELGDLIHDVLEARDRTRATARRQQKMMA